VTGSGLQHNLPASRDHRRLPVAVIMVSWSRGQPRRHDHELEVAGVQHFAPSSNTGRISTIRARALFVIMGKWSSGQPVSHDHEVGWLARRLASTTTTEI
jgi:hypothetical protein